MNPARILIADALSPAVDAELAARGLEALDGRKATGEALNALLAKADGLLVRSKTKVTTELLAQAPHLKVVGRAGAGVDNIDMAAATARGVVCLNTPGGNSVSVAEHVFAMLLALVRDLPEADRLTRDGQWPKSKFLGRELQDRVLALLGCGRIGSEVVRRARAFGMQVRVYDPYVSADAIHALGATPGGLEGVLRGADAVSLHLPLTDETRRVLDKRRMQLLNKGAVVINCARGGLVDEHALAELIQSGHVGGAGLDVFEEEPEIPLSLRKTHRVILTPHVAGNTEEAQERVGIAIARQVADFLQEGVAAHAVNLPNLSAEAQRAIQPYLPLARNLARLAAALCESPWTELGLRVYGDLAEMNITLLRMHVLAGLLSAHLEGVSPFNAEMRARERGITVVETRSTRDRAYRNLVSLQLRGGAHPLWIEGAHLAPGNDRLVSLNGIAVEAPLAEPLVIVENEDVPGVVGAVGTCLGEGGVNIGTFGLGRARSGSIPADPPLSGLHVPPAVALISVDEAPDSACLAKLQALPHVLRARFLPAR